MNGTNNDELFFKESKKLKRERLKWITLLITTNLITLILCLPNHEVIEVKKSPWPNDWVEVTLNAEVLASGSFPLAVSVMNSLGIVVFKQAYIIEKKSNHSNYENQQSVRLMLNPNDLSKLSTKTIYKILPYSDRYNSNSIAKPSGRSYEIHF